jgi:hypothetical protein
MGRKIYVPRLGLRENIRKVCGLLALVCARGLRSTGAVQCLVRDVGRSLIKLPLP